MVARLAWFIVLVGFLTSAACALFVGQVPPGQILDKTPADHYLKLSGVRYHYQDYAGPKSTIFLLHGFASSTYTWKDVAPRLNRAGFRVVALDMKGFGWSDKPLDAKYDPATLAAEVAVFFKAKNLGRVVFVGNSLGGAIGLIVTLQHPRLISRLILIDAARPQAKTFWRRVASLPLAGLVLRLTFGRWAVWDSLDEVYHDPKKVTYELVKAYYDRLRTEGALEAQRAVLNSIHEIKPYYARAREIKVPTLIIWGASDKWVPVKVGRKLNKSISGSRLVILKNCGHVPQEECPAQTARLIVDFITSP
jgi:pimeloyl-ACP methyl ester carboxylesterase